RRSRQQRRRRFADRRGRDVARHVPRGCTPWRTGDRVAGGGRRPRGPRSTVVATASRGGTGVIMTESSNIETSASPSTAPAVKNRAEISPPSGSRHARILGVGSYRPKRAVTNEEICQYIDSSDEWIRERSGIVTRGWADDSETVL